MSQAREEKAIHVKVYFDFVTMNFGSRFTGRSGSVEFDSLDTLEELQTNLPGVQQVCIELILKKKPTYKIVLFDIKSISATPKLIANA